MVVGIIDIFVMISFIRSKKITEDFFMALFIAAFAAFLFLTKMHERYSLLPLVFLLLFSLKKTKFFTLFILLSMISFINHYHNWAVPRIEFIMKIIDSMPFVYFISLMNVVIFFYLLWSFFLSIFSSRKPLTTK